MKRFLTTGLVLLAMTGATASFAQSKRTYDDDIYYNSKTAKEEKPVEEEALPVQKHAAEQGNIYTSNGTDNESRNERMYDDEDDYVNYDDEYSYSTQINRLYYPFYNRPYWNSYYNPSWYNPYWVYPNSGWSPWIQPTFSISVGVGGPYWSSFWGWQSWYGYGGFSSYYGYPGYNSSFYSGYWNGYYAGFYNYCPAPYRTVTYGPRYSLNAPRNSTAHNAGYHGFRRETPANSRQFDRISESNTPRSNTFRSIDRRGETQVREGGNATSVSGSGRDIRSNSADTRRSDVRSFDNDQTPIAESSRSSRWNSGNEMRNESNPAAAASQPRRERGSWFGGGSAGQVRSNDRPTIDQRSFSQPRMEQRTAPAPRMQAPSRGMDGGGGRSFGGGGNNGGGMRGGRR